MELVQRQDSAAFALLLDRHLAALGRFLYRFSRNTADADELAQESFLRVWKEASRWQPNRVRFTTWLYRIARNLAIDQHRRRREVTGDAIPEPVDDADPAGTLEAEDRRMRVRAAIDALPERQRSALLLCHFQGFSNQEAADILEVSVDALESLLSRARRALKTSLRTLVEGVVP